MARESNKRMFAVTSLLVLCTACAAPDDDVQPKPGDEKMSDAIYEPLRTMFQWPSATTIQEKRLGNALRETGARGVFNHWLRKAIASSWLPSESANLIFIKKEVDGRDVVRLRWSKNGYDIQVSQTATIFTIKLTPKDNCGTGKDDKEKLDFARGLCLRIFAETGTHWKSQGGELSIEDLPQKIASFSFSKDTSQRLKGDENVLVGRPRTMEEEGVSRPMTSRDDPDNPNWCYTPFAWQFWFRRVHWWNDGKSIGIHFLKDEGGQFIIDMGNWKFDREWFDGDSTKGRKSNDQGE